MEKKRFSEREGHGPDEKPITIRNEAPKELRDYLPRIVYKVGQSSESLRELICDELRTSPDYDNNWGVPNIRSEIDYLLETCEWYQVYDIIEAITEAIPNKVEFENEVNEYFKLKGIGWKLEKGVILFRGDNAFELTLEKSKKVLENSGKTTASNELKEAISDLSRKPDADITGAIQHAAASLECLARESSGSGATLGKLIKKHKLSIPKPLDGVIDQIWGYASNNGRHLLEANPPTFEEAELLVGLSASIVTYLARKLPKENSGELDDNLSV